MVGRIYALLRKFYFRITVSGSSIAIQNDNNQPMFGSCVVIIRFEQNIVLEL